MAHLCLKYGACRAIFQVSFYWAVTEAHPEVRVLQALTAPVTPHFVAMHGLEQRQSRFRAI